MTYDNEAIDQFFGLVIRALEPGDLTPGEMGQLCAAAVAVMDTLKGGHHAASINPTIDSVIQAALDYGAGFPESKRWLRAAADQLVTCMA